MAELSADVTRLQNDVAALKGFVDAVKAFIGSNPPVNTAALETALTDLEASISEGSSAIAGANQQPAQG